jgi:signal transduction histidine kinase
VPITIDHRWRHVFRYGLAVVSVAAALGLTMLLRGIERGYPTLFLFYGAAAATAWFGGSVPGWLAVVLATLTVDYFFIPPLYRLELGVEKAPLLVTFAISAAIANALSAARRGAEQSLKRTRAELAVRVDERTAELRQTNEVLRSEITQRRRAEDALRLLAEVTAAASAAASIPELASACLARMCELRQWPLGQVWFPDPRTDLLLCSAEAGFTDPDYTEFRAASVATPMKRGQGLPGRVWESGRAGWVAAVVEDDAFQRVAAAQKVGLRGAFAFPVSAGPEVVAVFEFLAREMREPDQPFLDAVETLGRRLGDLLERRRAEESLRTVQSELEHVTRVATMGELAASLAHELNQSLAAVVTNGSACLRWLARDRPDIHEAADAVRHIIRDANRASEVIAHTRTLLKRSGGEKAPLDVTDVIREVLALVRPEMQRHRIVVESFLAADLPAVVGARVQLQQVALNLIVNGIEAMAAVSDRPRELVIRSQRQELDGGPGVLVAVRDAGVGLAEEDLDRIFDAFHTTKAEGLGMGLAISRSIIQAHGGRLWATRNAGHGATFQFVLPAASGPVS